MDPRTARMLAEHEQAAASAPPPPNAVVRLTKQIDAWARAHRLLAFGAAIVTLIILFFVYYQLVAVPAQQRERVEREVRAVERYKTMNAARQVSLDTCLATVKTEADGRWNNQCRVRRRGAACSLPDRIADRLEREESQARNACLTQFSIATQ